MRRIFLPARSMISAATPVKKTWIRPTITEARLLSWETNRKHASASQELRMKLNVL